MTPAAPAGGHSLAGELAALLPPRFLEQIPFDRLPHVPRYLKALLTRIERAALNPSKDQERARQIAPYQNAWNQLQSTAPRSPEARQAVEEFRWMIEEFKVSVFAQELGTAFPVSAKRLDEKLARVRQLGAALL
jgi:ATP-dependent helicase HrpA